MQKIFPFTFLLSFLCVFSNAQTKENTSTESEMMSDFGTKNTQSSWAGFIGANTGYTNYNKSKDVEGVPSSLKLLGSYVIPDATAVFDLGYGIQYHSFSQKSAIDSGISTGVLEFGARYILDNRWQLGGVFNQYFNKGESYGANQADAMFAGVQIFREIGLGKNYLGRLGGRIMTSLNNNSESVNMALIDFQIGWNNSGRINWLSSN